MATASETGKARTKAKPMTMGEILSHPLRCRILAILTERIASPVQIAHELKEDLSNVSYHTTVLLTKTEPELIELVDTEPVRGCTEHFYRAVQRPELTDEDYEVMTVTERIEFGRTVTQLALADVIAAMENGVFGERHDHHVSRFPTNVDESGWKELRDIHAESLEKTYEVVKNVAERTAGDPQAANIRVRSCTWFHQMPPLDPAAT